MTEPDGNMVKGPANKQIATYDEIQEGSHCWRYTGDVPLNRFVFGALILALGCPHTACWDTHSAYHRDVLPAQFFI